MLRNNLTKTMSLYLTVIFFYSFFSGCISFRPSFKCSEDLTIDQCIDESDFNGTVFMAHGEEIILHKGYGFADAEKQLKNDVDTKFRIGSITKQFTATAILQLYEAGKLDIMDPVSKYIPDYPNSGKILIRHLLNHSSGIANITKKDYDQLKSNKNTANEIITRIKNKKTKFEPGEKFSYSPIAGYQILGFIIETVSGIPYEIYLQKYIFEPIDMKNTGYADMDSTVDGLARGYRKRFKQAELTNISLYYSAGGLYSTTGDLYRWDRALYTEKLVSKKNIEKMFTPSMNDYGFGWVISVRFERKVYWHNGTVNGFFSFIARFPDEDLVIIVLSNTEKPVGPLVRKLADDYFNGSTYTNLD